MAFLAEYDIKVRAPWDRADCQRCKRETGVFALFLVNDHGVQVLDWKNLCEKCLLIKIIDIVQEGPEHGGKG